MAIAMAFAGAAPGNWLGSWLAVDVALKIMVALVLGWAVGRSLGRLLLRVPAESDLSRTVTGIGAVAATFIVYGLTEASGGYGFIATFVCAASIRGLDRGSDRHRDLHGIAEVAERMLLATIMILFGGAIVAGGLFDALEWRFALVAIAVVLVMRPLAGAIGPLGFTRPPWRDRAAISFYGIRGIATFYYLAYALGKAQFDQAQAVWATAGLVVLLSIVLHGLTAAPVMQRLDRRRELEHAG